MFNLALGASEPLPRMVKSADEEPVEPRLVDDPFQPWVRHLTKREAEPFGHLAQMFGPMIQTWSTFAKASSNSNGNSNAKPNLAGFFSQLGQLGQILKLGKREAEGPRFEPLNINRWSVKDRLNADVDTDRGILG